MGMSGAPLPYYVTYLDPASSFNRKRSDRATGVRY